MNSESRKLYKKASSRVIPIFFEYHCNPADIPGYLTIMASLIIGNEIISQTIKSKLSAYFFVRYAQIAKKEGTKMFERTSCEKDILPPVSNNLQKNDKFLAFLISGIVYNCLCPLRGNFCEMTQNRNFCPFSSSELVPCA